MNKCFKKDVIAKKHFVGKNIVNVIMHRLSVLNYANVIIA